jgi:predicted negative regulator of RcsB-dependent stress response
MDYVENRIETAERVKKFWTNYGNIITIFILVVILLITGYQYWQSHKAKVAAQAAGFYQELVTNVNLHNTPQILGISNQLTQQYAGTPYATFAAMVLAKQAISQNNLAAAISQYQWIIEHTNVQSFKTIAQLDIARILLAQNNPQQAMQTLAMITQNEYMGQAQMLTGDAYLAMQQRDKAKDAYQQALNELETSSPLYTYVEMKLYNM